MWSAIGAALGGAVLDNVFADNRQDNAQEFSAQQFASRYQTTVKDMEKAGLNPALAYQQGGGNAPSGVVSSPGNQFSQAGLTSAQIENVKADTSNKAAQAANIRADTFLKVAQESLTGATTDQTRANISFLETQSKKIVEEIKNIPEEGNRLRALIKNLGAEYNLIRQKTATEEQATNQMKWLAVRTMLDGDLLNLDLDAAEAAGNIGREMGQYKPIIDLVFQLLGARTGRSVRRSPRAPAPLPFD